MMSRYSLTLMILVLFAVSEGRTQVLNDYNPYNVSIQDNGPQACTDLLLSGAPAGAEITSVRVYYEVRHTCPGDLEVWLTTYYDGTWHDYMIHDNGDFSCTPDDIVEDVANIHEWNGASPNQEWYLCCRDRASQDVGYIDFFELWVSYSVNSPPGMPYDEEPGNGETDVDVNANLDWRCNDPDGDTIYYTVYLEKDDSTPNDIVKEDAVGSYANIGQLDYESHYYWRVKADDHNGGVTWAPASGAWHFYTEDPPVTAAELSLLPVQDAQMGQTVSIHSAVENTGNTANAFGVGAEIRRGGTVVHTFDCRTTLMLAPGGSQSVNFTWSTPTDLPEDVYTARVIAWSGACGSSTWLDSEDETFSLSAPDFPINSGLVAFHRYSSDSAYDSQFYIMDLASSTLTNVSQYWNIDHPQNGHFSPDGTKLVFFGVPEGEHSYSSREIYLWDLTTGSPPPSSAHPIRLTDNDVPDEDPKFSFSGRYITFKSNQDLAVYDLNTGATTFLTHDGWASEQWAPFFSRDDQYIYYTEGTGSNADLFRIRISSHVIQTLEALPGIQEYYPVTRDDGAYYYTRWYSSVNQADQLYLRDGTQNTRLPFNSPLHDYSDACPVDSRYVIFTSTRGPTGSYDLFLGDASTGAIHEFPIAGINTAQQELGCSYSPTATLVSTVVSGLSAERTADGVLLSWRSGVRNPEAGFDIYRSMDGGPLLRVNNDPIRGEGSLQYLDRISSGASVDYTLECNDESGSLVWSGVIGLDALPEADVATLSAYPNPFNPATRIRYTSTRPGRIVIGVYDLKGQRIATLVKGTRSAGTHWTEWDGRTSAGHRASAGTYLVRMEGDGGTASQKVTLVE